MSVMITIRMPHDHVARLDALVASGEYSTRAEVVRAAVVALLRREEEAAIDRAIVEGYTRIPQTAEELVSAELDLIDSIRQEPW
jgi:Arc/MetJ-type ribon-helix-helix transcriptional regulator